MEEILRLLSSGPKATFELGNDFFAISSLVSDTLIYDYSDIEGDRPQWWLRIWGLSGKGRRVLEEMGVPLGKGGHRDFKASSPCRPASSPRESRCPLSADQR